MEELLEKLKRICELSNASIELIKEKTTFRKMKRGDLVLPMGSVCNHFYFVKAGAIRNFYLKDGRDITEWITLEGSFCFSITSFFKETPSSLATECLEDSEIGFISKEILLKYSKSNFELAELLRSFLTGSLIMSQQRMESIQFETAKQRYSRLLKSNPDILRRVPLMYIASFLGMSVETLSRIRSHSG